MTIGVFCIQLQNKKFWIRKIVFFFTFQFGFFTTILIDDDGYLYTNTFEFYDNSNSISYYNSN